MKKYISVFAIMLIISLAACSNQNISSAPISNESNIQSNSITTLDKGIWPVNEYTEGLPIPPGTVAWATLDTEHENCNVNLTGISDDDYSEYMEVLNQEGFSVIENVSEEIEEGKHEDSLLVVSREDRLVYDDYFTEGVVYGKQRSLFLLQLFIRRDVIRRLDVISAVAQIDDKVDFKRFSHRYTVIFAYIFHNAHIHRIAARTQFVVYDVFHDVCVFLLAEVKPSISQSHIHKVILSRGIDIFFALYIETQGFFYQKSVLQIAEIRGYGVGGKLYFFGAVERV